MKNLKNLIYIAPLVFAIGCAPEFEDDIPAPSAGSADFSTYVSVGNSLTAGFQSNALRRVRQENSFPAILAGQLKLAGGGEFKQPLLDEGVGIGSSLNAEFGLDYSVDCLGETSLGPAPIASQGQIDQFNFPAAMIGASGPFNNVGVPGAKSYHLAAPGYGDPAGVLQGTANPYYARFVNPQNLQEPVINQAVAVNASFFSLWIGNNDILGYATSGGIGQDHNKTMNIDPTTYGSADITNNNVFANVYNQLIGGLTANGATGVITNIPNITSIPYFTTIPTQTPDLRQGQADSLNAAYAGYNALVDLALAQSRIGQNEANLRKVNFSAGANGWIVIDSDLALITDTSGNPLPKMRQLKPGELLTLTTPSDSLKCFGMGTSSPIPEQYVLTRNEINSIQSAIYSYNSTIEKAANDFGLAFVDANAILKEMESGISFNGVTYSTDFVTGGAFSLDGVHPNTVGYAIIANAHIDAINEKYGANIPRVSVDAYEGIVFP